MSNAPDMDVPSAEDQRRTLRDAIRTWEPFLDGFEAEVLPMFLKRGYSRDAALLAWNLNSMENHIVDALLTDVDDDDSEPWKRR